MNLIHLAERVEALTGPDREVDARIHVPETRAFSDLTANNCGGIVNLSWDCRRKGWGGHIPAYTSSLDAAMLLLPAEPSSWGVLAFPQSEDGFKAFHGVFVGQAATPALALTAAALRARSTMGESDAAD
jgi:hypothetical protein